MNQRWMQPVAALALATILGPAAANARGLGVEVWTDRGMDATYQPGQRMEVEARTSDDGYLLVYEIDTEGYVRLLFPYRGGSGFAEGRRTYRVPPDHANVELVVQQPVGQCYIVAVVSHEPFRELPWYLRPYDTQAEHIGYEGMLDDEDGITAEGRIVGDPFVAMEKIRRRVLEDPDDPDAFGTAYATYYVHTQVRYPRYLCYDCHRPGRWAWWAGFDPYYTHCSVFDFRVNWSWGWGPSYWFGYVPYYYYVARHDCPPFYLSWYRTRARFSSWDGWRRYKSLWGGRLIRYKTDPPAGYVAPTKFRGGGGGGGRATPPGFVATDRSRTGPMPRIIDRGQGQGGEGRGTPGADGRSGSGRMPRAPRDVEAGERTRGEEVRERARPLPRREAPREAGAPRPAREERGGRIAPPTRYEPPAREERSGRIAPPTRYEPPAREERGGRIAPPTRYAPPAREERSGRIAPPTRYQPPAREERAPRAQAPREDRSRRVEAAPRQDPPRQERSADPPRGGRSDEGRRGRTKG